MKFKSIQIRKAAAKTAAFCLFAGCLASLTVFAKSSRDAGFEIVKKKAINLLMQKQKKQALATIEDFILAESNKSALKEAKEFRLKVAKEFLTKEAQEAYELSLNETIDSPKDAKKYNEECLALEPENLDCLIQRARLLYREKSKKPVSKEELEKTAKYFESLDVNWLKASSEKSLPEFKNEVFFKRDISRTNEDRFVLAVLEIDRSVLVKNFSKAKEILSIVEKDYPDWPDLIYFKEKLNSESSENKDLGPTEISLQYQNKCKSLSKSVVRKYRYDFDLCLRGTP